MAAFKACIGEIERAAGRPLTNKELDDIGAELRTRQRERAKAGSVDGADEDLLKAAQEYADEKVQDALRAKRRAAIDARARLMATDYVRSQFGDQREKGLEAILVGINSDKRGSRESAALLQETLGNTYGAGFVADMELAGHWDLFTSGAYDREISHALGMIDDPAALAKMPKDAVAIAKIMRKWQDTARINENKAGADIRVLRGRVVRQAHDQYKIMAAGYEKWKAVVVARGDLERSFRGLDGEDLEAALRETYKELAAGRHLKVATDADTGFRGTSNLAKKVAAHREIHFKSADDWFEYNKEFGNGSLRESFFRELENAARATGLMRKLGTNYENNFNLIVEALERDITNPAELKRFTDATKEGGWLRQRLAVVDGTTRSPVNEMGARYSSGARVIQNMAKLGSAVFSSVTDLPVRASELKYQGRGGYLDNIGRGVADLFKGKGGKDRIKVRGAIGAFTDSMRQSGISRFSMSEDGVPGALSKMQRLYFKFNFLTPWTDRLRTGALDAMAHLAALDRNLTFDKLDPEFQRVLGLFNIDAPRWDVLRAAETYRADGRDYMVADAVLKLPDEKFRAIAGEGASAKKIDDLKNEIADQYRAYLVDRGNIAVIDVDARSRAVMTRGSRPGTVQGELLRFFWQFKSFGVSFTQNVIGRELFGRGASRVGEIGKAEMVGFAQLLLSTAVFGYIAMNLKDLAKGRTPRSPADWKTWAGAFAQGGGAGIYSDFLFGELRNRYGGGFLTTIAGPTAGSLDDIADILGRIKAQAADPRSDQDVLATTVKTIMAHAPINFFYTRAALDYLILYQISEAMSPGYLRRMEQRIEKENNQTFLVRPSQWVQ